MENKIEKNEYIYAFMYCPCIHESAYGTVSLHRTESGANAAMELDKEQQRKEHEESYSSVSKDILDTLYVEFGTFEDWKVDKITLLD
jgi:hypothetical protein